MRKDIVIILGTVAVLAIGFFFLSQQKSSVQETPPIKNSTENWSIYQSESGSFTLKYPSDWFVRQKGSITLFSNVEHTSELSDQSLANESVFGINIHIDANPKKVPIEKWFEEFSAGGFPVEPDVVRSTKVGGRDAVLIEIQKLAKIHIYMFQTKRMLLNWSMGYMNLNLSQPMNACSAVLNLRKCLRYLIQSLLVMLQQKHLCSLHHSIQ